MNASSFAIVIMSRTRGTLCSDTRSSVSSEAAIAGSAEFFAPLIATVPCSGFPPLIKNLSIRSRSLLRQVAASHSSFSCSSLCLCFLSDLCVKVFSLAQRRPQISLCLRQQFPRGCCVDPASQHNQPNSHIVSRRTQCVFRR